VSYPIAEVRSHFPALEEGAAHFDGPGGSQTPDVVADAVAGTLRAAVANRGVVTTAELRATGIVTEARQAMADLLRVDPRGVVFGRSMTQLTYDLARTLSTDWGPGDEIVVTRLDHDANIRPWVRAAELSGATVKWADFDRATGELAVSAVTDLLSDRTRLVAVTAASNLLGTRPDAPAIAEAAHAVGALVHLDGVHLTPHAPVDVPALGVDFYACAPYKFLGPHLGVLAADPALLETLHPDKLLPASDAVPERFELGTLPYELLAGTTAAVDFLAGIVPGTGTRRARLVASMTAVEQHEAALLDRLESGLAGDRRCHQPWRCRPQAHADRVVHGGRHAGWSGAPTAGRVRRERACRQLLRAGVLTVARSRRRRRRAGRDRAVHRRIGRRPAAGRGGKDRSRLSRHLG
jgi:cysteine desulfurase family protein (TIGR01976 family)